MCPEVFTVTDRSRVNEGVNFDDFEAGIKEAAESCPVEVIKYE
ncbi:ferredoxin [Phocaeicola vulgatus]